MCHTSCCTSPLGCGGSCCAPHEAPLCLPVCSSATSCQWACSCLSPCCPAALLLQPGQLCAQPLPGDQLHVPGPPGSLLCARELQAHVCMSSPARPLDAASHPATPSSVDGSLLHTVLTEPVASQDPSSWGQEQPVARTPLSRSSRSLPTSWMPQTTL